MRIPYVKEAVVYESKGVITADIPDMDAAQGQGITDAGFLRGKATSEHAPAQYKQTQAVKFRDTDLKNNDEKIKRFVLNK